MCAHWFIDFKLKWHR